MTSKLEDTTKNADLREVVRGPIRGCHSVSSTCEASVSAYGTKSGVPRRRRYSGPDIYGQGVMLRQAVTLRGR